MVKTDSRWYRSARKRPSRTSFFRSRLVAAMTLAVLENSQQLRLQVERQFPDLVEEQRALGRLLEVAGTAADRAGEGALGMTEQCRLHKARRNCGAVQRQIGAGSPLGQPMQRFGGQFLAAARFALDQYRERRIRVLLQLGAQQLHRRAVPDQLHSRRSRPGLRGEQIPQCLAQLVRVGRLGDEVGGAQGAGVAGVGFVVLAGEDDDRHVRRQGQKLGDERETFIGSMGGGGQTEVDQGCRRQMRQLADLRQRLEPVRRQNNGEIATKKIGEGVADQGIVVDQQQR
jgi:hypothetical protein